MSYASGRPAAPTPGTQVYLRDKETLLEWTGESWAEVPPEDWDIELVRGGGREQGT